MELKESVLIANFRRQVYPGCYVSMIDGWEVEWSHYRLVNDRVGIDTCRPPARTFASCYESWVTGVDSDASQMQLANFGAWLDHLEGNDWGVADGTQIADYLRAWPEARAWSLAVDTRYGM